jgi:hypothetical protein
MADNVAITAGTGTAIAADDIASVFYQRVKLSLGADGAAVDAVAGAGAVSTAVQRVTLASDDPAVAALQILDNAIAGSEMQVDIITVPAPLSTTGGGTEATALRVTLASDSTGVVSIDDNGGALTVDNGGTFAVQESGGALTALQLIDDSVATLGTTTYTETTTKGLVIGALRRDADTSAVDTTNEIAPLIVDANGYLKVEIFDGGGSHTIDNAGTFVVQENGAALTALQIMDDWDETDRCKVNLIVGQAGIAAGAGAVGVTVPRFTLSSDDPAVVALQVLDNAISGSEMQVDVVAALPTGTNSIGAVTNTHLTNALIGDYETVAASQTAQTLGATGGTGDYLAGVLIVPATTSPGNVIILDNATSITIFTGGASSVSNLVPFMVPLGMLSVSGAWKITTGANVSAIGIGNFT